jgi:acyl-CoA thioesterase-1
MAGFSQTILVMGDSISSAYGMPVKQGWVTLLQKRLQAEQLPYKVVNLSISGDTSANVLNRLPQALVQHQPHILLLETGGNDGLRGLSLAQMRQNLESMITLAVSKQIRVMLLGIQLPPNYGSHYTDQFSAIYRQLANQYQVALLPSIVDGIGGKPELMQVDGIHPNAKAQPMMLELVWPGLQKLLSGV